MFFFQRQVEFIEDEGEDDKNDGCDNTVLREIFNRRKITPIATPTKIVINILMLFSSFLWGGAL